MLKSPSAKILILFIVAGAIIGCTKASEDIDGTESVVGNVLRMDVPMPFTSLDPATEESGSLLVFYFLYDKLFSMNEHGELVAELADSFHYAPDDRTWTIDLKKGPCFHDGSPITANDVVYSLSERLKNLRPEIYETIEHIASLTDKSVCIVLKKDDPEFIFKVYYTEIIPEPVSEANDYYNRPVGSGPFRFEYRDGDREVGLVANENYHKGRPSLDRIIFYYEADSEKSWARLIRGSTDLAFGIQPTDYEMLNEHQDRFWLNAEVHPLYAVLLYNTYDPILCDSSARTALSLSIDKESIVKEVLEGYGQVAVGPIALNSPYHNRALKPVPYDPQRGIRLLMEAGWIYDEKGKYLHKNGRPFEISMLFAEKDRAMKGVAEYIQLYLNDIGVKARIIPVPIDALLRRYIENTDFQAVLTEMGGGTAGNPALLKQLWAPVGSAKSAAGCFEHPDITRILTEATTESRPERIKELFQQAEALIVSLQPGTFLFHRVSLNVISKRIDFPYPLSLLSTHIYRLRSASVREPRALGR